MNPLLPLIYVRILTIIEGFLYTVSIPNFLNSGAKHGRVERFRNDAHRLLLQVFRLFVLHHFSCHEDDQSILERFSLSKGAKRFKSIYSRIMISRTNKSGSISTTGGAT